MPRPTPGAIARRLVSDTLAEQLHPGSVLIDQIHGSKGYAALVDVAIAECRGGENGDAILPVSEASEIESRIRAKLDEATLADWSRLDDSEQRRHGAERDAMLLIGIELGRQMGGVR